MVQFSAFRLPEAAIAPSLLAISTPFWSVLKKNNFTIIFSDFFSVLDRMKKEFSGPNFGVLLSLGFLIYGKF